MLMNEKYVIVNKAARTAVYITLCAAVVERG
jgi:hypothetical protein